MRSFPEVLDFDDCTITYQLAKVLDDDVLVTCTFTVDRVSGAVLPQVTPAEARDALVDFAKHLDLWMGTPITRNDLN